MDWQVWSEFFKQNWLIILVALIILFLVINLVKTVIKWLIVIIIAVALFIYSGISMDQIKDTVSGVTEQTLSALQQEATEVMKKEAADAKFEKNQDGTYTIRTTNLEVVGTPGKSTVGVTFRGVSLGEWDVKGTMKSFIEEAKSNASTSGNPS